MIYGQIPRSYTRSHATHEVDTDDELRFRAALACDFCCHARRPVLLLCGMRGTLVRGRCTVTSAAILARWRLGWVAWRASLRWVAHGLLLLRWIARRARVYGR